MRSARIWQRSLIRGRLENVLRSEEDSQLLERIYGDKRKNNKGGRKFEENKS